MTNAQILAEKLYKLRKQSGISQEELADKLGVSRQAVSKWERGEAMPDTENLIAISKLYKTSLDELIGNDFTKADDSADGKSSSTDCGADTEGEDNKTTSNANSDGGVHVEIGNGKIVVDVKDCDDEDCDDNDDGDDDEDDLYDLESDKKSDRKIFRVLRCFPYPVAVTIAFLLWGILSPSGIGWRVGWTLFLTIPLYYNIIDCVRHKRFSSFAYPVFITFAYCFIGMAYSIWHPTWIIFISVPIYYVIADSIDKA